MQDDPLAAPQEVSLIDESGQERKFRLHDSFELEGAVYYLVEGLDDPEEVLLLRETDSGLATIDQEEFERVMAALDHDEVD